MATQETLPLRSVHEALGASFAQVGGRTVPRHYGDQPAEYDAATGGSAVVHRPDRALIRVFGREPVKMLNGLITNDLAGAADRMGVYAAVLTPKGKMVADVRAFRRPDADILLDTDASAADGLTAHLRKFVPPLFARFEDVTPAYGVLTVLGPGGTVTIEAALGTTLPGPLPEDGFALVRLDAGEALVVGSGYAGRGGHDLVLPAAALESVWTALVDAGARPAGHGTLEVLRIEAGRPRWGAELDESVIPLEAGLGERAISGSKGCYTGQEVIIRILHRGHVNWHLRWLRFGDAPAPAAGASLVRPGESKVVGRVTSACFSPRNAETVGLGYVRREVEPPAELQLADDDGAAVRVVALPSS